MRVRKGDRGVARSSGPCTGCNGDQSVDSNGAEHRSTSFHNRSPGHGSMPIAIAIPAASEVEQTQGRQRMPKVYGRDSSGVYNKKWDWWTRGISPFLRNAMGDPSGSR